MEQADCDGKERKIAKRGNQDGMYMKMGYIRRGHVLRLDHIAKQPKIRWMKTCRPWT